MRVRTVLIAFFALALPHPAAAWHNEGHMAVARVAWEQMTDGQRTQAYQILLQHPHKNVFLAVDRPAGISEPVWFFVRAATWPDWVRSPDGPGLSQQDKEEIRKIYNKPGRHFVNLPFVHPNDVAVFNEAQIRQDALVPAVDDKNEPRHAVAAVDQSLKVLQQADANAADKAIALCWVIHLIGDLH